MNDMTMQPQISDGRRDIDGRPHIGDGKGGWVPVDLVKPQHLLEDETVRKIVGFAIPLSEQVSRFAGHTFDDINAFEALLAQEYGAKVGGKKGNKTLTTHDGLYMVKVQVADHMMFGPELQVAKALVDECLNEWASDARDEIRTLVTRAFDTDREGQINRAHVYMLLRLDISDPRWVSAMQAIRDAMRVVGSKTYVRCYRRDAFDAPWQPVVIDLARV
jgi:hypothetical protein